MRDKKSKEDGLRDSNNRKRYISTHKERKQRARSRGWDAPAEPPISAHQQAARGADWLTGRSAAHGSVKWLSPLLHRTAVMRVHPQLAAVQVSGSALSWSKITSKTSRATCSPASAPPSSPSPRRRSTSARSRSSGSLWPWCR